MSKIRRPRPFIPLHIRVAVAERQVQEHLGLRCYWNLYQSRLLAMSPANPWTLKDRLESLLWQLFGGTEKPHLDHRPALILRPLDIATGKYSPDANDPKYLEYVTQSEHLRRTIGRMVDAKRTVTTKGSDIWLKAKFARLENTNPRRKAKIPSRPFAKRKTHV